MQRIELLVAVEKELGGDVEESVLAEIYTVRQLVDAIRESAASGKTSASSRQQPAGWKSVLQEESDRSGSSGPGPARPTGGAFPVRGCSRLLQIFAYDRFHLRVSGLEKLPAQGRLHYFFQSPELSGSACAGVGFAVAGISQPVCGGHQRNFRFRLHAPAGALAAGDRRRSGCEPGFRHARRRLRTAPRPHPHSLS